MSADLRLLPDVQDAACEFCSRRFETERGRARHARRCSYNPDAPMFTSGDYDPILSPVTGKICGFIWNGRDEHERRRIRASLTDVSDVLGIRPATFGPSHRVPVLGPDHDEQCGRCPETRRWHEDLTGTCTHVGCRCQGFIGQVPA